MRILYDFSAEGANELTAYAGEEFLVINAVSVPCHRHRSFASSHSFCCVIVSLSLGRSVVTHKQTLFDGWIQVRNNRGEEGIVPSTYVEPINDVSHTHAHTHTHTKVD